MEELLNKETEMLSYEIEGIGDPYTRPSGEIMRMVYVYNNDDESREIQLTYVPNQEITAEVLANPEEYVLVTYIKGAQKIKKIVTRTLRKIIDS